MLTYIIIYLIGVFLTIIGGYSGLEKGWKITVLDIMVVIVVALTSWLGLILVILLFYGDKVVFIKK